MGVSVNCCIVRLLAAGEDNEYSCCYRVQIHVTYDKIRWLGFFGSDTIHLKSSGEMCLHHAVAAFTKRLAAGTRPGRRLYLTIYAYIA
jgi:hypothetical protein